MKIDDMMARTMVEAVDPRTGEELSEEDRCADADIQKALVMVPEQCSIESVEAFLKNNTKMIREKKRRKRPRREREHSQV